MSSNAETIKDFLVSLGFDVDQAGQQKFEAVIKGVTANVLKMGASVEGGALAIVGFTGKIARGLDKVYWASQRTGASAAGIKSLGYAASQAGSSAEAALSSLEGLAKFMRSNPSGEGYLNRLGISTRDAQGQVRDMAMVMQDAIRALAKMPQHRAMQYAKLLGIDENTLLALKGNIDKFGDDYQQMVKTIGFDADKAAKQSNTFTRSLTSLFALLNAMKDKIGSDIAGGLSHSVDKFKKKLLEHFPKIETVIKGIVKGIFWLSDLFSRIVWRVVEAIDGLIKWWKELDTNSKRLIATVVMLIAAWKLLNAVFAMSPIGMILSLITAIGLLWEDYQTWKEGGESLIDWGKWEPYITKAIDGIKTICEWIDKTAQALGGWDNILKALLIYVTTTWAIGMVGAIGKVTAAIIGLGVASKTAGAAGALGKIGKLGKFARGATVVGAGALALEHSEDVEKWILKGVSATLGEDKSKSWKENFFNKGLWWASDFSFFTDRAEMEAYEAQLQAKKQVNTEQSNKPTNAPKNAPRGIRNNNPGNLNYLNQSGAKLESHPNARFAAFSSAYDGLKAMAKQLMRYFEGKTTGKSLQSVRDIISTWAPNSENDTNGYIQAIAKKMGVNPDTALNLSNPQVLSDLMANMITHENGYNPYGRELMTSAAAASINQKTEINVYGVSDPVSAAHEVSGRQMSVNSMLAQQTRKGVG